MDSQNKNIHIYRYILIIPTLLVWSAGIALVGLGIVSWVNAMHSDFQTAIWRNEFQSVVVTTGWWPVLLLISMMAVGSFVFIAASLGFFATAFLRKNLLTIFVCCLILCIGATSFVGGLAIMCRHKVLTSTGPNLHSIIRYEYLRPGISRARSSELTVLSTFQLQHKCCGADGFLDYRSSSWYNMTGSLDPSKRKTKQFCAPPQCCVAKDKRDLLPKDETDRYILITQLTKDPEVARDFLYVDAKKCYQELCAQSSVEKLDTALVNIQGCTQKLVEFVDEKLMIVSLLAIAATVLELFVFIAALVVVRRVTPTI